MRKMILCVAFAVGPAWAQAPKQEAPKLEAPKPPQEAAKPVASKPAAMAKKSHASRRSQDARHCLDKGDNTAIIKCAEEYL
jgi:hypothetical protein